MSPSHTRVRSRAEITTPEARTKDLLEAFRLYYGSVEISPFGDLELTCGVCRSTSFIDRKLLADAGHVLAQLNWAHRTHGPHAPRVRR